MILPFSTQLNGKPTYFVEKINQCLRRINGIDFQDQLMPSNFDYKKYFKVHPKLHTIRDDKNNRWKPGVMIDYFINCRQPNMFRFAPRLPVVSTQEIEIENYTDTGVWFKDAVVSIDGSYLNRGEVEKLAQNDGFDTVDEFFEYFKEDFKGKIIHWTDLRY